MTEPKTPPTSEPANAASPSDSSSEARPAGAVPGVLDGIRVLELGQVLAGPFAGAIFADLGAEVLKIERTDGGELAALPVEVVALEDGAEQVRLQELVDDGGEVEDGTLHRTAGNLRLVRLAGSEQLGTGARRPAGLLAWCILDPALLARLHDLEQLAEGVEALGEARVGVKLHQDFLGFTQGQARIQPGSTRR